MFRWLWMVCVSACISAQPIDFEQLMGKETAAWSALETAEDWQRLAFFKESFYRDLKPQGQIPKILHFIWLGPASFPKESQGNIAHWIEMHPGWQVKLWTDKYRQLPDHRMELVMVDQLVNGQIEELYYQADHYAERASVVAHAILMKEGGVVLEHDMCCLKPLDPLQQKYDFFCGLEPLGDHSLSSSVNIGTHLLASIPGHPILQHSVSWLIDNWKRLDAQYPGKGNAERFYRMQRRMVTALNDAVELGIKNNEGSIIVFPADYFNQADAQRAVFATHLHAMSWKKQEADQQLFKSFDAVRSQLSMAFVWACVLGIANVVMGIWVVKEMRRL